MVFNYKPFLTIPTINISNPCLNAGPIVEGESINTRIYRNISKGPDIRLINFSYWALCEEIHKIIFKFFMIMADLVRTVSYTHLTLPTKA